MKIRYKNYIIQDDRNGYILQKIGIVEDINSKNHGGDFIQDQVYPATLDACIAKIFKYEKMDLGEMASLKEWADNENKILKDIKDYFKKQLIN